MAQRNLLVKDLTIQYEGLFDAAEMFKLIDDWFQQNGYDKNELRHVERVKEKGKQIELEIMPDKVISDYVKYEINVLVRINDLVETEIKRGNTKMKINKGVVTMTINAYLYTDKKGLWESKPMTFFLRTLFDKFLFKKYLNQFEDALTRDVQNFHSEMKAYLNLNRFTTPS